MSLFSEELREKIFDLIDSAGLIQPWVDISRAYPYERWPRFLYKVVSFYGLDRGIEQFATHLLRQAEYIKKEDQSKVVEKVESFVKFIKQKAKELGEEKVIDELRHLARTALFFGLVYVKNKYPRGSDEGG